MKHKKIRLIIDDGVLREYDKYYFSIHKKAHKRQIPHPYHESINVWMIMNRSMMNALKQRWKKFIQWYVTAQGYANLRINKCEIAQKVYYPNNRRHDVDNSTPKFVIDGLVESGMIVDDDCNHITKLTLECGIDIDHPRTELIIKINDMESEEDLQNEQKE